MLVTPAVTETRYRIDPPYVNVLVTPAVTETRYRIDPPYVNVLVTPAVTETRYRWVTRQISPCRVEWQGPPMHGSYVTICSETVQEAYTHTVTPAVYELRGQSTPYTHTITPAVYELRGQSTPYTHTITPAVYELRGQSTPYTHTITPAVYELRGQSTPYTHTITPAVYELRGQSTPYTHTITPAVYRMETPQIPYTVTIPVEHTHCSDGTTVGAGQQCPTTTTTTQPPTTTQACLSALGSLGSQPVTRQGSWSASGNCLSSHRGSAASPRYAHFYSFTLGVDAEVTINLSSSADTYLFLLSGHGTSGSMLHDNDDSGGTLNSSLSVQLTAGNYTIEATTYARRTEGSFTLNVATDIETSETSEIVAATVTGLDATYNATVDESFSLSFSFEPSAVIPSVQSVSPTELNLTVRNRTSNRVWITGTPTHTGPYDVEFALTQPGRVDTATTTVNVTCPAGHTQASDRTCDPPAAATVTDLDATYNATVGELFISSFSLEPRVVNPSVQSVSPQTGLNLRTVRSRTSNRVWMIGTPTHAGTYDVEFALTQPGRVDTATTEVNVTCPTGDTQASDRTCQAPVCTQDLGAGWISSGVLRASGSWESSCVLPASRRSTNLTYYAKHYTFNLLRAAEATIDLTSDQDTYLFLIQGDHPGGLEIHHDDDGGVSYNSRLSDLSLQAGDYTVSASTYHPERTGEFDIRVTVCSSDEVSLSGICYSPLARLDHRHEFSFSNPPPGHQTNSCYIRIDTADDSDDETRTYFYRRVIEARVFIDKTSNQIYDTSRLDPTLGTVLQLTSGPYLEGCQSVGPEFWQCDWRADQFWTKSGSGGSLSTHLMSAFTNGIVRPAKCARAVGSLFYAFRAITGDPRTFTAFVDSCGALFDGA